MCHFKEVYFYCGCAAGFFRKTSDCGRGCQRSRRITSGRTLYDNRMTVCNACAIYADQYIDYSGGAHHSSAARRR
jgi:hypothetical protein